MDRLKNLVLGNAAYEYNDSIVSNDFNWNDISVGNDTISCDKFFRSTKEFEQTMNDINDDLNNVRIIFEETRENDSNILNTPSSIDSRAQTSISSDECVDERAALKRPLPTRNNMGGAKPRPPINYGQKVPNVVLAGKLYEQKKKQRMEAIVQREREQRQFHANKAPDFTSIHAARHAKLANVEHKISTVPVTPKVVHTHRKNLERTRAKLQEAEAARQPKPFVAKQADVLVQPPFVPQHTKKSPTKPVPFNLHSDERMRERHHYDEQYKLEIERREREQEEKRKVEEEHIRREIRKATTFKARPNPFS